MAACCAVSHTGILSYRAVYHSMYSIHPARERVAINAHRNGKKPARWNMRDMAHWGHLAVLQWVNANGNRICDSVGPIAALGGHLHVLRWLHMTGHTLVFNDCAPQAIIGGHLHTLQWLLLAMHRAAVREQRWITPSTLAPSPFRSPAPSSYLQKHAPLAAHCGHIHILEWLGALGCTFDTWTFYYAASGGHLHVLQWLYVEDCPWDADACFVAAYEGHLHALQWLRARGCPWSKHDCMLSDHEHIRQWVATQV